MTSPLPAMASDPTMMADQAQQRRLPGVAKTRDPAEADRIAKDFESVFLAQMLKPVFEDITSSEGMFSGGHAETIFTKHLVDEFGKIFAESGGIGIADMVRREILELQEVS